MSPRLPRVTAGQILRVLRRIGFEEVRSSGSHRILKNAAGKRVTVPYHAGEILHPKVLQSILRDIDLSVEELRDYL
ncbi:MAG: type II toxin-antitoxin system HicA family toxin [candidate division NC10 bacterium]|nr:type II toxin-antitoxin system HicA family toxin [candidate division NC10 bacterium]